MTDKITVPPYCSFYWNGKHCGKSEPEHDRSNPWTHCFMYPGTPCTDCGVTEKIWSDVYGTLCADCRLRASNRHAESMSCAGYMLADLHP